MLLEEDSALGVLCNVFVPSLRLAEGMDEHATAHMCLIVNLVKLHRRTDAFTSHVLILALKHGQTHLYRTSSYWL